MDTLSRNGEHSDAHFRSERFFTVSSQWYFTTREGLDSGPYADKNRAEDGLQRFLKVAKLIPDADKNADDSHRLY